MTHRTVRVLALALLAACAKADNRTNDSAAGLSAATTLVAQQRGPGPGELKKALADYTGDQFYFLVNDTLRYSGDTTKTRNCRPNTPGCTPGGTTRLQVWGVVGEDSVVPSNIPALGVIVSKGLNLGGARDNMYNTRPGAPYTYFLIVYPGANGNGRWVLEEMVVQGANRSHSTVLAGTFRACTGPGHPYQPGARANFYTCDQARPASMGFMQPGGEPPWWIGCGTGCCINDGTPG